MSASDRSVNMTHGVLYPRVLWPLNRHRESLTMSTRFGEHDIARTPHAVPHRTVQPLPSNGDSTAIPSACTGKARQRRGDYAMPIRVRDMKCSTVKMQLCVIIIESRNALNTRARIFAEGCSRI